jgi:hypothetical protein
MDKEKQESIARAMTSICEAHFTFKKKCEELEKQLQDICPIKFGDKVEIVNAQTDEHIRFAYFLKVEIGGQTKGTPIFKLDKAKKDGSRSNHRDWLGYNEAIKRIS